MYLESHCLVSSRPEFLSKRNVSGVIYCHPNNGSAEGRAAVRFETGYKDSRPELSLVYTSLWMRMLLSPHFAVAGANAPRPSPGSAHGNIVRRLIP